MDLEVQLNTLSGNVLSQIDTRVATNHYTKTQVDTLFNGYYTTNDIDTLISPINTDLTGLN